MGRLKTTENRNENKELSLFFVKSEDNNGTDIHISDRNSNYSSF